MSWISKDYSFWIENEEKVIDYLEWAWYKVERTKSKTSIHDFFITHLDKKVNVELKTRRVTVDKYSDTLIGANKLGEAWNRFYKKGEETLFFFSYTDWLFYINPFELIPRREFKLQRYDRWIDSAKWWIYYNTKDLKKIY